MDRHEGQTSSARPSLKRKLEPEFQDQNEARKNRVVEDPNKEVQSKSTTTSTSVSRPHWNYDVFLSFRGEDIRKNFIDHLNFSLVQVGIRTFRDDEELQRGNIISTELLNAIRGSRISIVVFSKGYASSWWCLDELVEILHCKNTIGHSLLPIFYHVNPSDVRKQTGIFAEALARHEERFQTDMERMQRWREALTEAANCSGWDLESVANGYESRFIKEIVKEVLCKVNPALLDVAKYPIGMESRVDHIKDLLNLRTRDVRIVGIYGMGGIGKTTLAKAVYNEICVEFEGSSFLSNLKESSEKPNGLVHLQEQFLNDILKTNLKIGNVDRGISIIEKRIHGKKVLVILDDVDDFDNLHMLVEKQWFGSGSRIIVTTRDEHLLSQLEVDEKYKVQELNHWESLQLFNWHALNMANPKEDYSELSIEAVDYARGLPLALAVLGSFLKGRSIAEWKSELEKLRRTPHAKIQKILRISFDSLDNPTKDIFLDIAFFFVGMDKEYAIKILDDCNFSPGIGISILIQRSLVTVDYQNKLKMHNLIRDMGREIVCEESPKHPGKRSRLWFHEDVINVLHKRTGSETIEGFILNLPALEDVHLKTEAFTNMKNLRLLQINYAHLTGSYEHLSKELKWLCWHKCPLKFLPQNFHLENLVILDMQHSNVKQVWEKKKKIFNNLKVLNLSNSKYLIKSPDFSQVPQLEILILEGCTSLVQVHESIGDMKRLISLNLRNCTNLKDLPRSIFNLESLETLDLSGCSTLEKLPKQLKNTMVLPKLLMDETAIKQLPSSFGVLKNLKIVSLFGCSSLTELPNFLTAQHLERLVLEGCTSLVEIHESIEYLKRLVSLNLKNCTNLKYLPRSIYNLESLETLDLSGCSALERLPEQIADMMVLTKLHMDETEIKQLPSSFGLLKNLKTVSLYGCSCLIELPNFLQAPHLESLILEGCTSLVEIHESIGCLKKLVLLDLQRCENLRNLPNNIYNLESLVTLDLSKCFNLYRLPEQLENMTALTELYVENMAIKQLPSSFSLLKNLETLSLRGCECLIESPEFLQTSCLETLILEDCTSLVEVHKSIGLLKRLVCLSLGGCKKLRNLPSNISNLTFLETLVLSDCIKLDKLPEQFGNMMALKVLLANRTAIEQLPISFGLLRNLEIVLVSGRGGPSSSWISPKNPNSISLLLSIFGLCSLTKLDLSNRNLSEDEIPIELGCLSSLRELVLSRNNFRNLPSCISYLPGLSDLFLNECTSLQSISLPISVQLLEANGCTSLEKILILTNESSRSFYLNRCHKLVEVQSLKGLRSASNVLMGRCNNLAYDFRKNVLQMLCKNDGGSLCLPGSEIPNWISHQKIGSLISFRVPSVLDCKIGKVVVCVVYATNKEEPRLLDLQGWFNWTFCNKTRNPQESYRIESKNCYFDNLEDHIFVDVMRFHHINLEMKSGDEIELSIDLGDLSEVNKCEIQVKKCGIHLLVGEPNVIDED